MRSDGPSPRWREIWWAQLDPAVGREQSGRRPLLIVSSDRYNLLEAGLVAGIPLTTRPRNWPTHVEVRGSEIGIPRRSFAMVEQTKSMSIERLHRRIGRANIETMDEVSVQLVELLEL